MHEEKFLVSGPIWLLQLWLNSTFEPFLNTGVSSTLYRWFEGIRLDSVTPYDNNLWLKMLLKSISSCLKTVPNVSRPWHHFPVSYRLQWFKRTFPTSSPRSQIQALDILMEFFKRVVLSTRISTVKASFGFVAYQANFVAKQFGFNQFSPKSLFTQEDEICLATDTPIEA